MKSILISAAACLLAAASASAQSRPEPKGPEYEFTVVKELPVTSIKDQHRSGTCWCFSTLSLIESEILRTKGKEVNLSEMFVIGKSYHDRAVKYVRLDGHLNFAAGSSCGDVLHVINDYGIIPEEVYSGYNYGTEMPEQAELDAALKGYVEGIRKNPNRKLTTAWVKGFDGILEGYLGEVPATFTVDGVEYTTESYRDYLGINPDDYISLTSFTHHPFYEPFIIEVCDNWRWDSSYNLPLDEMVEVIYNALDKGYTVAWATDVSENGFTRNGIGVIPAEEKKVQGGSDQEKWIGKSAEKTDDVKAELPKEMEITQEMRQDAFDRKTTTDDHGMHIYGLAKDQNGTNYFIVKNSWGKAGKYEGIWYISEPYVRYKTINIMVHKDALPKHIAKKLDIR